MQKIEKLKSAVSILDVEDKPKNTHTFYVESKSEGMFL